MTISYKHYSDSLLENGMIERRIANAIMGLEGLLLKPSELQELVYRLSNRVAKVLGNFNLDPLQVRKVVSDAYKIRNLFAHGGHLGYKDKKKYEERYGSLQNLLRTILDYLRISLIVTITIRMEKDEFIDLIDVSFLDRKKEEHLFSALGTAKYTLSVK